MDSYDKEGIFEEKYDEPFVSVHVAHNIIFTCVLNTVLACDDT